MVSKAARTARLSTVQRVLGYAVGYWGLAAVLVVLGLRANSHPGWNVALYALAGLLVLAGALIMLTTWWRLRQDALNQPALPVDYGSLRHGIVVKGVAVGLGQATQSQAMTESSGDETAREPRHTRRAARRDLAEVEPPPTAK
jgi:hypothetical protein